MKAVILAGGKGTRLRPYTATLPKPLVPIGDTPILEVILRQLRQHQVTDLILCVGHMGPLIQSYFGNGEKFGVHIDYHFEEKPLGTAGALGGLKKILKEDFFVLNGDLLTTLSFTNFLNFHRAQKALMTIAVYARNHQIDFGCLEFDRDMRLQTYREKPMMRYQVSMGAYVMTPAALDLIEVNQPLDIPELMARAIQKHLPVIGYQQEDCYWLDIGRIEDFEEAQRQFETNRSRFLPMEQ